ncbi:MAG: MBL fold metallo-hydrolase [Candidatus Peregrinibacteria bacterium]
MPRHGVILGVCVVIALLTMHELMRLPDGRLHADFFDVGMGNATLLTTPSGKRVLIDGGPDLSTLEGLGKRLPFFDRSIDLLVLTHAHADHIAALPEVLRRYRVQGVLWPTQSQFSPRERAMLSSIREQGIPVKVADAEEDYDLGDGVLLDVLWPDRRNAALLSDDLNDGSTILRVLYASDSLLLPGDATSKIEQYLLATGLSLDSTVLEVPHHGSKLSSSTGFLLAVSPDHAIVSVNNDNDYGLPHPMILERYKALGIPLESTAKRGTISIVSPE